MPTDNMSTVLFRFGNVRPPQPPEITVDKMRFAHFSAPESEFELQLAEIRNNTGLSNEAKLNGLRAAATEYKNSSEFFRSTADVLTVAQRVKNTVEATRINGGSLTMAQLPAGDTPLGHDVVSQLYNALIALMISGGQAEMVQVVQEALQAQHIWAHRSEITTDTQLRKYLFSNIVLPQNIFPLPTVAQTITPPTPPTDNTQTDRATLAALATATDALTEIMEEKRETAWGNAEFTGNTDVLEQADWDELPAEVRTTLTANRIQVGQRMGYVQQKIGSRQGKALGNLLNAMQEQQGKVLIAGGAVLYSNNQARAAAPAPVGGVDTTLPLDEYNGFYPAGYGSALKPLGVMDLLRVEQRLCSYVAGEVAHIENLMGREYKDRSTRHLTRTIDTTITETERETTTLRDTQTTERFEMQTEAFKEAQQSLSVGAGITASYNTPVASVSASANFALSQSKAESMRTATDTAREITERASQTVSERIRETRSYTRIEEFEEINRHGFDNRGGADPVVGIYRWVDKVYNCYLRNYGKRLMFELMIPEPAALYKWAMQQADVPAGFTLKQPISPTDGDKLKAYGLNPITQPEQITDWDSRIWAGLYGADISGLPSGEITLSKSWSKVGREENDDAIEAAIEIPIPDGYESNYAQISFRQDNVLDQQASVVMSVYDSQTSAWTISGIPGSASQHFKAGCEGVRGTFSLAVTGLSNYAAIDIKLKCRITGEAFYAWRLKTYNAIMAAYQRQVDAYNSALSAAKVQAGVQISGQNPAINRQIEQTELKRASLELLRNHNATQPYGSFWNDDTIADGYTIGSGNTATIVPPMIHPQEAIEKGNQIRFFEQVFEWEMMNYSFLPYFYGRQSKWKELYRHEDADPLFQNFLQAGYARIQLPVRRGYENQALNFLSLGTTGGSAKLAVSLEGSEFMRALQAELDEMKTETPPALDDVISGNVPTWKIKIPTTLVVLQKGGELTSNGLPSFECGTPIATGNSVLSPLNSDTNPA